MRIAKYILGYILGVGFFFYIFFFFGQFPYDRLKEGLIQSFEDSVPLSLSIGRIAPSFPLSLGMERIRVGSEGFSLQLPDLIVHPNLGQILLGNPSFEFSDGEDSSRLAGRFQLGKNQNRLNLRLNKLEIQASIGKGPNLRIKASGEASFQWEGEDFNRGRGQLWSLLEREELQKGAASQIPLPLVLFDTLRAEVQVQDGIARVKRLEASGKQTRFSLPQPIQVPLKGQGLPPELALLLQLPGK
jgi:type II secretion system protein N